MKKGFTLLELLIVVIIIGLLATLALPNFLRGAERARWSEAKNLLGALRGSQIRYYAQYETYATNLENLDVNITDLTGSGAGKHFSFTVEANENNLAQATRTGGPYRGATVSIDFYGNFSYSGAPEWLQ
ncbi:MAG: prepilin-type N-terminal cleavage/methylation domain-containing protein [Candidatus Omnitrophica bacterium]|nr:prepilin-type N-terminal cleavage/methylation domain-containing protein [Candidatus Omnitrophota bacterium]